MPSHLSTLVLATHWLIVGALFLRILARRRPVGVAVAWLAVIASAPFVGGFLYLRFDERRLGRARAARIGECVAAVQRWQESLRAHAAPDDRVPPLLAPVQRHAHRELGFPALRGDALQLLHDPRSVFDALIADVDAASDRVLLCFYIWHEGGRADELFAALERAARRGVACRGLADAIGSRDFLRGPAAQRLRAAGVQIVAALPSGPLRALFVRRDLRNHRKIVVVDGRVAYAGSQNLVDPRFFKRGANVGEWIDAMARIEGPTACALEAVFALDWAVEVGEPCAPSDLGRGPEPITGETLVQVAPSGPGLRPEAIHQLLLTAIYAARRELVLTTPYFVPSEAIQTALLSAALRGVRVTLLLPARNDSALVRFASASHFDELLVAGARIALFDGGLLHTKSLTVDGELSVFGSVNLDMRSLWLNFEISLFLCDQVFTSELRALQDRYLAVSHELDLTAWRRRSRLRQLAENACRLLGPLL